MTETRAFDWQRYPAAEAFISERLNEFVAEMPVVHAFSTALLAHTGSRFSDWLDHLVLIDGTLPRHQLAELGFEPEDVPADPGHAVYYHPSAIFPRVLLRGETDREPGTTVAAAIQVEDISHFLMANQLSARIDGLACGGTAIWNSWQSSAGVIPGLSPLTCLPTIPHATCMPTSVGRPGPGSFPMSKWACHTHWS